MRYNLMLDRMGAGADRNCISLDSLCLSVLREHSIAKSWEIGRVSANIGDAAMGLELMRLAVDSLNERIVLDEYSELDPLSRTHDSLLKYLDLINNIKVSLAFEAEPFNKIESDEGLDEFDLEAIADALAALGLPPFAFSLFSLFENLRRDSRYMSWADPAYDLCREPEALRRWLKSEGVDVLLIDEFHDTKASHFQMLSLLKKFGVSYVAAGDPAQDIYEFRGIAPFNALQRMLDAGALRETLTRSYRFGSKIGREVFAQLSKAERQHIELDVAGPDGAVVHLDADESLAKQLAKLQPRFVKHNAWPNSTVIVVPSNPHAMPVMRDLLLAGMPVRQGAGMPRYGQRLEVLLMRGVVLMSGWVRSTKKIWADDVMAALELLKLPAIGVPVYQREEIEAGLVIQQENAEYETTFNMKKAATSIAQLRAILSIECQLNRESLQSIIVRWGIHTYVRDQAVTQAERLGSELLLNELTDRLLEMGGNDFIADLDLIYERGQMVKEGMRITSVLQSKAMEWPVVIMPPQAWHSNRNRTVLEQRERYIAMSRAKSMLLL
ncbi:UvrD-helicase domain-containing protein [Chitinilyticum piscinae]|uniref:UvrD-helicase domain-containing protein n=1 Tax=Chitinilyticum piscinae TaxID=2866724 RepID=UPI001881D48F|nr:UvrD-helicase domain-containing protein [Chitinilyticum piscinae]